MNENNNNERYIFDSGEQYNDEAMRKWWRDQVEIDNEDLSIEDIAEDLGLTTSELSEKELKAMETLLPSYKAKKMDKEPDLERWYKNVWEWREDEKANLNKRLNGNILVIADLGKWDGRRAAHKFLGDNLNEVLTTFSDNCTLKVYCDDKDVMSRQADHDGVSNYIFRLVSEEQRERIEECDNVTRDFLMENSESLRQCVADIYGWCCDLVK